MTPEEHKKLDFIDSQSHGKLDYIADQVTAIFKILNGTNGALGMTQKVAVMWRVHVWLLCTATGAIGVVGTLVITHYLNSK